MQATYARRWNSSRHRPIDELTSDEAQARDAAGEVYAVALGDPCRPSAVLEVNWALKYLGVWFFDSRARQATRYTFTRIGDTLFLDEVAGWTYPNDNAETLADAVRIDWIAYRPDGIVKYVRIDNVAHERVTSDRSGVDVRTHSEPVPRFGDWASLPGTTGIRPSTAADRGTRGVQGGCAQMGMIANWPSQAACRSGNPDALFVQGAEQKVAKRICRNCPVRYECLADALDNRIEFGVWGGMTERERRALLRRHPLVSSWRKVFEAALVRAWDKELLPLG